eukprot:scaffold89446_cov30-Tisochrysis_lutea.AAC.2
MQKSAKHFQGKGIAEPEFTTWTPMERGAEPAADFDTTPFGPQQCVKDCVRSVINLTRSASAMELASTYTGA